MKKEHDKWKHTSFGEFDAHANAYLSELVDELLREKGIEPGAFAFKIVVDYVEADEQGQRDCAALHHDD